MQTESCGLLRLSPVLLFFSQIPLAPISFSLLPASLFGLIFRPFFYFIFVSTFFFFFRASPRLYRVTGALSRDLPPFSFDFIRFYVVIVFFRGRFFVDVAVAVAVVLHISADYVSLGSFYCGLECFFSRRRNRLSAKNKTKQNKKTSVVPFRNIRWTGCPVAPFREHR